MKNVIVVFGGKSCEHDISVITGVLTLNTINSTLFNAIPIYIATDGTWYTGKELSDISFYKTKKLKTLKRVSLLSGSNTIYIIRKGKLKPLVNVDCAINCTHGKNGEDGTLAGVFNSSNIALVGSNNFSSSFSMDKEFTKT
ncbi:MAG: D-alanine--D-alanine ligase, partial [Clostridia bacterium]|nr:D-alanine--D-alanine ligase [Clostridia bacterium]